MDFHDRSRPRFALALPCAFALAALSATSEEGCGSPRGGAGGSAGASTVTGYPPEKELIVSAGPGGPGAGTGGAGGNLSGASAAVGSGGAGGFGGFGGSGGTPVPFVACPPSRQPPDHVVSSAPCSPTPPMPLMGGGGAMGSACATDADCQQANCPNVGTCTAAELCEFDQCQSNQDCAPSGRVCACAGAVLCGGQGASGALGNTCLPGNCATDADCGPNGFCSPDPGLDACISATIGIAGYECHTCQDECFDVSDCAPNLFADYCAYDPTVAHWVCAQAPCAG